MRRLNGLHSFLTRTFSLQRPIVFMTDYAHPNQSSRSVQSALFDSNEGQSMQDEAKVVGDVTPSSGKPLAETFSRLEGNHDVDSLNTTLSFYAQSDQSCTDEKGAPLIKIDPAEEAQIRRKMDRHIFPIACAMFMLGSLDRSSMGYAKIAGLEESLHVNTHSLGFNWLMLSFAISFLLFEAPVMYACKRFGPHRIIPYSTTAIGLVTMTFAFCTNLPGAIVNRIFLGMLEPVFFTGSAYHFARWYRKDEILLRISIYAVTSTIAQGFGGLMTSAILMIDHIGVLRRWQMIFMIEGALTSLIGLVAIKYYPSSFEDVAWLSEREKKIAAVRLKLDNAASSTVVDGMRTKMIRQGAFSATAIVSGLMTAALLFSLQSVSYMMPSLVSNVMPNAKLVQKAAFCSPPYFLGAFFTILVALVVMKTKRYTVTVVLAFTMTLTGYALAAATTVDHTLERFFSLYLIVVGSCSITPIGVTMVTINSASDSERAGAITFKMIINHALAIGAAFCYVPSDAPNYKWANVANTILCVLAIVVSTALAIHLSRENKRRERGERDYRLDNLTPAQQELLGHRHPGFRYRY